MTQQFPMNVEPPYACRFIKQDQASELIQLYHTAKTAVGNKRYDRMLKAADWFVKDHPEYTTTAVYKDLDGLLG